MDGILVINKPQWLTSHDVVLKLRRKLGQQKIGHAGTLDPLATGVLIVLLGRFTKLVPKLINQDKEYDVTMTLGIKTDTGDITGKTIEKHEVASLDTSAINQAFDKFKGEIQQTPPMVSAKKHKGKPLYKYARQGKIIHRDPKKIQIYSIEIKDIKIPRISFSVHCSKGTYIRTLCEDVGQELGPRACASAIHRTRSGPFGIDMAVELDALLARETADLARSLITRLPAG